MPTVMTQRKTIEDWLLRAGIEPDVLERRPHLDRVIIDLKVDEPARIYMGGFIQVEMMKLEPPDLSKAEIVEPDACATTDPTK